MALHEHPNGLNILLQILKDINKCITCQKNEDNHKGNAKLTSSENGRERIINCSSCLKDNLLEGIFNRNNEIKYHVLPSLFKIKRTV